MGTAVREPVGLFRSLVSSNARRAFGIWRYWLTLYSCTSLREGRRQDETSVGAA